jgi:hypothetical protein
MHLQALVRAVAEDLRTAWSERGEAVLGHRCCCLVHMDRRHAYSSFENSRHDHKIATFVTDSSGRENLINL